MFLRTASALICLTLLSCAGTVAAAPYVPAADSQVLERLPFRPNDPTAREIAALRAQLQRDPRNLNAAVQLATSYYKLVAAEGDPRFLGYAQAALAPWWQLPAPPIEVQMLRAMIRQFQHGFEGAISDLTKVIERDSGRADAYSIRAMLHIVQARYPQARSDCSEIRRTGSDLIATGCEAMVDGLTGKMNAAYGTLLAAYQKSPNATTAERMWIAIRLAELAQRQGRNEVAESHFKQALGMGITDTFLLAAYSDFLLDQKRPAEVEALLRDKTPSDALLLRLVFAERTLGLPNAKARADALAARFAAARLRGETVHEQEEARFILQIENEPKKALAVAIDNWKVQREPRDARIYMEAALAAKDPAAAQPVLQWLDESKIEDATLIRLGQQLKGERK